jgi:hypothetical protein
MATRRCCCNPSCELGLDDFNRVDANPPSGRWHEISGNWSLTDQYIKDDGTPGILATTICHPVAYEEGSWIANFQLKEVRSREMYRIRAGNPSTSPYEITFEPLDMDLATARIKVTVIGPSTTDSVEHPWPVASYGGTTSADSVNAFGCYQPGVMLRASIGSFGGQIPVAALCIGGTGSRCYVVGGVDVGNFAFIEGAFDNWQYWATAIDDLSCIPCGCYCLKGLLPEDRFEPERECFPASMKAIFQLVYASVDASACVINDFEILLNLFGNNRDTWLSGNATICTTTFAIKLNCENFDEEGRVFRALTMQLINGVDNQTASIALQWDDPDYDAGETPSIKFPDFEESTCEPLSLVYKYATLQCFFGPCDTPGVSGYIPYCCPEAGCLPSCPTILYRVTLVPA